MGRLFSLGQLETSQRSNCHSHNDGAYRVVHCSWRDAQFARRDCHRSNITPSVGDVGGGHGYSRFFDDLVSGLSCGPLDPVAKITISCQNFPEALCSLSPSPTGMLRVIRYQP
jgi:hypothetical protein